MNLILASGSPRRAELLERMGLQFIVRPSNAEEILEPGLTPQQEVLTLSRQKAEAVAAVSDPDDVILSADTIVVLEDQILGKPKSAEDAERMLTALSGKTHQVLTGVTILRGTERYSCCEETEVRFRTLSQREIQSYITTGEPMDKAGAYGIQGYAAMFITGICGDYYNVMGLPVCRTALLLREAGISVLGG